MQPAHPPYHHDNDVAVIRSRIADQLGCDDEALIVTQLTGQALRSAFADYASDHAPASVGQCRSTWNGVLDALVADGAIPGSPIGVIPKPKMGKRVPKPLRGWDEGTVDQLLAGVAEGRRTGWTDRHWRERDEALVDLLVAHPGHKGNKERVLPVPTATVVAIPSWSG